MQIDWTGTDPGDREDSCVTRAAFDALMSTIGATPETTVVFYGDDGNRWASYSFALFQLFAHANVKLLEGGRASWISEGRPLATEVPSFAPTRYRSGHEQDAPARVFHEHVLIAAQGLAVLDGRDLEPALPAIQQLPAGPETV